MRDGQGKLRVIKTTTSDFGETPEVDEDVFWQGDNSEELSVAYPPSNIYGADQLGHTEIEDGYIRFDYRFEQLVDGSWQTIEDPRVRLTPLSDYEREIDAENRRLFPGDYADEYDDGYDDDEDDNIYGYDDEDSYDHLVDDDDPDEDATSC